ncbi:MAG: methylmalonyl Co-A mutase-associated GTPase MeaB [Proteobacteria bacterium]|nr:methylmalonyl Co-A mutase-associated GTPase MeaB [Pseudomonadota bacterium]
MKPQSACDLSAILERNRLALARAISRIENHRAGAAELHAQLLPHCGRAHVIGITGAPGAGKSTLINVMLQELLRRDRSVAVVAVDPSSPISGGAILGDRVRMVDHGASDAIFIRSVSSRGHLGGLSRTTGKIIDVFDAAGFDIVIVETVGTGQSEVEISRYADTRIVVCPPGLGDEIQAIKAGILEIADILVVNKGDLPLAQRTQLDLQVMRGLHHPAASGWVVPVMRTVATSGEGIAELLDKIDEHARAAGIGQRLATQRLPQAALPADAKVCFGEFASTAALGVTLAHSLVLGERKLKKVISTVKIIPLGVNRRLIEACRLAIDTPALEVAELLPHRAALILSEQPGMKENVFLSAASSSRQRLETLGSRLAFEVRCAHSVYALANALRQSLAAGCELILMFGATMTKDRSDVAPAAIVAADGTIERFGMPVEPGNMLVLARIGKVPVIVLPGCARSQRLNGLDWVLRRLLAKLPVNTADLAAMGVGGLIRSAPEEEDEQEEEILVPARQPPDPGMPRIAALVLAAGRSSRMDGSNKLLELLDGIPLVLRVVNAALASHVISVTVVTGHAAEQVETAIAGRKVTLRRNPDYAEGMASSLRCGIDSLPADIDGALVLLGDMPLINAAHIDALIGQFASQPAIVVPMKHGQRGNPVIWPRNCFAEIRSLQGDQGARQLLARHAGLITKLEMASDAIFADVDTPEMLAALNSNPPC